MFNEVFASLDFKKAYYANESTADDFYWNRKSDEDTVVILLNVEVSLSGAGYVWVNKGHSGDDWKPSQLIRNLTAAGQISIRDCWLIADGSEELEIKIHAATASTTYINVEYLEIPRR